LIEIAIELHLAELRLDLSRSSSDFRALGAVDVAHLDPALLRRTQVEVRLHHRSQHLAPLCLEHALDLVQRRV
jgi:hypothetical protein